MFDAAPPCDPQPLQQSEAFERALQAIGTPTQRLPDGMLVVRRSFGPTTVSMITRPQATSARALCTSARALGTRGPVIIAPDTILPLHTIGALPLISPTSIATLDLRHDLGRLRAGLHQKWRNRLKHAERQNLRLTRQNMPDDPQHWLFQAEARQQRQRRYRHWPGALTLAYARENRGQAKLFSAYWGREPIAAMLILRHGATATYHIGHTRPAGRIASAHTLLLWAVIRWAQTKGVAHLELGSIDTEDGKGLARFKLGTGAGVRRLGGTWVRWAPLTQLISPLARMDRKLMLQD
ncbi:GNAT family N-acetyltransferase [Roseobacter sp. YSTF-M11]|uniref:GNAT family N-acetyltransferase n=1 Tax=Roseobacter insulae TaxID=2859783 RepID=A0A9X1JYD7_9RHOB|nr:GNAT family N-acetyltransferase [Roseobacter insulae]MBW4708060.1 GNAT family N-acetyltransferase [Roseobacter insulae]